MLTQPADKSTFPGGTLENLLLKDRYRIDAELGRGGVGVVYRATDTVLQRPVAVKVLASSATDPTFNLRLINEALVVAKLNHPNIVTVYDAGEHKGQPFVVMELVNGQNLRDAPPASLPEVLIMARQICAALAHAHTAGVIHRDIKPENVMVLTAAANVEPEPRVKLMDFGLAHTTDTPRLTKEDTLVGTLAYLSPELIQGQPASIQSDLYALGVLLYEVAAGRAPFSGDSVGAVLMQHLYEPVVPPSVHNSTLPPWFDQLIVRLLSKQPGGRPASAGEILTNIEQATQPVGAPVSWQASLSLYRLAPTPTHNLPAPLSSFIGRERELARIKERLAAYRLVTLTGSGGVGKTRLAMQTAWELLPDYTHGIWLVELAPLTDPDLVIAAVASVIGVNASQERSVLAALTDSLREKAVLLVLDNCEHVIAVCAQLAEHLLEHCPNLRILASSREVLGIEGEYVERVPSLSLPGVDLASGEAILQSEAVRLFVERAADALPGFELTASTAPAIVQICRRLDGVALAIELAAARVKVLKVDQIATRLDDAFRLLTGGRRTSLPRQQTLRATLDWSYNLLSDQEGAVLRHLAVFTGGWSLEAAEAVCSGEQVEECEVLDALTQLANKSLVVVDQASGKDTRYQLLETTRQYAQEKLIGRSEGRAARSRHLQYYLDLAESVLPTLKTARQFVGLRQLKGELDNFRSALEWAVADAYSPDAARGLRLATALTDFWEVWGYRLWAEGLNWLKRGLELVTDQAAESISIRAKALRAAATLANNLMDTELARTLAEESLALLRAAPQLDERELVRVLAQLACAVDVNGDDPIRADALTAETIAISRTWGAADAWQLADALYWAAGVSLRRDEYATAGAQAQECLALFREAGDRIRMAWGFEILGWIAELQDDYVTARSCFEEFLRLWQVADFGNYEVKKRHLVEGIESIADLDRYLGNTAKARARYEEALAYYREEGDRLRVRRTLHSLGRLALTDRDYEQAIKLLRDSLPDLPTIRHELRWTVVRLINLAEAWLAVDEAQRAACLLGAIESEVDKALPANQAEYRQGVAAAQAVLDGSAYESARATGRAMTLEQAVTYALAGQGTENTQG
jgi:non-specific serine/threonine protein kinase